PDNRPICFPYMKRMVSLVMADLGAAIVMTTASQARAMTGGAATPVYFLGGAFAKDRQRFMVDKADFTRSPALATIAKKTQQRAGINIADVEGFDLYSCFPCTVNVARGELGIAEDDPRALTQTGGLGFFGGPGSNYAFHGIASLAENIAEGKLRSGMASAIGWFMHKYSAGIYSADPATVDHTSADVEDLENPGAGDLPVPCMESTSGRGTLETYTVIYARDQSPERSLLYGTTDDGLRFVANGDPDPEIFDRLTNSNQIGARVSLSNDKQTNINRATLLD
ncbi:MAG: acetyl-CoA C-acetyltransferase, partial [Gammaproteobacteria bacterium]